MNKALRITALVIGLLIALVCIVPNSPLSNLNKTVAASPTVIQYSSSPTNDTFIPTPGVKTGSATQNAHDNDNSTWATWSYTRGLSTYGTSDGYWECNVYSPRAGAPRGSTITQVDLKISYKVTTQASTDATLEFAYLVNPSGSSNNLYGPIRAPATAYIVNSTYTNVAEPNDASWSWEDITNLKFRLIRLDPNAADGGGYTNVYEVWATIHYKFTQQVAIDPKVQSPIPTSVEINVTGVEELYGFEFKLTYNTTVLTATGITYEYLDTVAGGGGANTYESTIDLDDAAGFVWATQSMTGDRRGGNLASGTWGRLANITFTVSGTGPTNLNFEVKLLGNNYVLKKTYPISYTLIQPGHDIAADGAFAFPSTVTRGDLVDVGVHVVNTGDYVETLFNVTIYADEVPIETKTVSSLGIGADTTVPFTWDTRTSPSGTYTISARLTLTRPDADPTNNIVIGNDVLVNPLLGDIDLDGWVDEVDLSMLSNAFGSQPGDPNWYGDADLDPDNIIDAYDLNILGNAWEPEPPPP